MKIAIDIQPLYTESRNHGIGRYAYNIVESLLKIDNKNQYFLVGRANPNYPEVKFLGNYKQILIDLGDGPDLTDEKTIEIYSKKVREIIKQYDIDVYHLVSGMTPDVIFPDPPPRNLVVTVYDLIPVILDYFSKWPPKISVDYMKKMNLLKRFAKKIIAISNNTKQDIIKYLDVPRERIETIYPGVDPKFRYFKEPKKFEDNGYILYIGGYEYRKNIQRLIQAYGKLPDALKERYNLVLDIVPPDAVINELNDLCLFHGVSNKVKYVHPNDEELVDLYKGASLLVYPSLYEGFGLPILEAMASGVPVVCSNTSSMPEVAGDSALLANPYDPNDIARKIETVLINEKIREELVRKGLERSRLFDWKTCANRTIAVYDKLVSNSSDAKENASRKYRIAFFSPLNPQPSGISDYSEELLGYLKNYFEIDVFVDGIVPTNKEIVNSFSIYDLSEFESRCDKYDIAIYHIGNNPLHDNIYRMMQKYPGILVLHDANLHYSIYYSCFVTKKKPVFEYLEEMALSHEEAGVVEARRVIGGGYPLFQQFPLNKKALLYSLGTIVFIRVLVERLKPAARTPIVCIPYGVSSADATIERLEDEKIQLRKSYGIPNNTFMICTAGFLSFERRLDVCLKAFDKFLKVAPESKYYIVGTFIDDVVRSKLIDEINGLGLRSYVILVPKSVRRLEDYILMSDVFINLRYPSNWAASSTLMRALAKGKPVIASRIPEFEDYPEDCVWKVDVADYEAELLFQYLKRLYEDPKLRGAMSRRALEYAKGCDWKIVASKYAEFIKRIIANKRGLV
ncbi:MAG: glycosyltransferase [Candidatus Bathyarchaeia archaeon]